MREEDGGDDEGAADDEVATDLGPATAETVDEHHEGEFAEEAEDSADGLVFEGVAAADTHLCLL